MTDPRQSRMSIGELARLAGVTSRAIRHLHAVGVLPEPARDASGYRRYVQEDLLDLQRIVRLRAAAVPLEEISRLRVAGWDETATAEALTVRAQHVHSEIERLPSLHGEITMSLREAAHTNG